MTDSTSCNQLIKNIQQINYDEMDDDERMSFDGVMDRLLVLTECMDYTMYSVQSILENLNVSQNINETFDKDSNLHSLCKKMHESLCNLMKDMRVMKRDGKIE